MKASISIKRGWEDEHVTQFAVTVADGRSMFATQAYAGHTHIADVIEALEKFKDQVHGGVYDLQFGAFGPEYAGGGFQARLHFHERGRVFVTARVESDYEPFSTTSVASHATLYFTTEPAALDNFITELKSMQNRKSDEAHLWSY